MSSFEDFLRWYNKKDVLPISETMQEMITFYHDKDIDTLNLGCTLPKLANTCLHRSTDAKFYKFTVKDKDILEKKLEKMLLVVHLSFLHENQLLMKLFFQKSTNFVRIDGSQQHPYSMCQPMPIGLYTHWDLISETARFTPRQNKTRCFENMVMSYFQRTRPEYTI